jgi:cytochrome oxidase Cu insertion factor (SCO1/SenC/PrrC family)
MSLKRKVAHNNFTETNVIDKSLGPIIQPWFITVDPKRDTPARIAEYVKGMASLT